MCLRVSAKEELEGHDIGEHGMEAYPGFGGEVFGAPEFSGAESIEASPASRKAMA